MVNIIARLITSAMFLLLLVNQSTAQNCSVNAGSDRSSCYVSSFELEAVSGGSLALTPGFQWVQTGGPTVTIASPASNSTSVNGIPTGGGVFTFSFSALCLDGQRTSDEVVITVEAQVIADAGPSTQVFCLTSGQTMGAVSVPAGQAGVWQVAFGSTDGVGIAGSTNPAAPVTVNADPSPQLQYFNYNWLVTDNSSGCNATAAVTVAVINMPTDAAAYSVAGATPSGTNSYTSSTNACYNISDGQSASLAIAPTGGYYYGGSGPVNGVWTLISKPAGAPDPTINNVYYSPYYTASGLQAGDYTFKWTLSGPPCVNVEKFLTVTVPATTGGVSKPVGYTDPGIPVKANYLCDPSAGATPFTYSFDFSTLIPGGALQPGEVINWLTYNPAADGTTIQGANTLRPSFVGLAGQPASGSNNTIYYQYLYSINNPATGCSINGVFPVWVGTPSSLTVTNESANVLPCGTTEFIMEYRTEGAFNDFTQDLNIRFVQTNTPPGAAPVTIGNPFDVVTTGNVTTGKIRLSNLTATGTYSFQLEYGSSRYCGINQHLLNVYASVPSIANAGSNVRLACGATSTQLVGSAAGGSPILWSQVSGPSQAVLDNNRSQTPTITGLVPGAYVFRYSLQGNGTCLGASASDDNVAVLVTPADDVASSTATPDQTVCAGAEVFLNGSTPAAGQTGVWTVSPLGPALDNANNPNVRVLSGTMSPAVAYTFTWTVTGGCNSATSDVVVTTTSTTGPNQASAGVDICRPAGTTSFVLTGNTPDPASTGTWTVLNNTPGVSLNNASLASPTATVPGNGEYGFVYTIQTTGCGQTTDTVYASVAAPPTTANAGPDVLVCGDAGAPFQSATLNAAAAVTGTGQWTQVGGPAGATISNVDNPATTVGSLAQGATYRFEWKVASGAVCSIGNVDTMNVTVALQPNLLVTEPAPGCSPAGVNITAPAVTIGSDAGTLSYWTDAAATTPLASPAAVTTPGLYYIQLLNANNCANVQPVDVSINPVATSADIFVAGNMAVPPGTSTTLTASSVTAVNPVFRWYADPALTTLLHEGAIFATPPITVATTYYVTVQGDNLCENATASVQTAIVALPLHLLSFAGRTIDKDNHLEWVTTAEEQVCCFEIERSRDGNRFATLGRLQAVNSALENRYHFADRGVAEDYYYRLKMIDLDGDFTYSSVIFVQRGLTTSYFRAMPNPFESFVDVRLTLLRAGSLTIQVFHVNGSLIRQQSKILGAGAHTLRVDGLGGLPAGQYLLRVVTPDQVVNSKLIKQ